MGQNINQLPTAATSILSTDKMYLGRSPFDATDDRYILGSSIIAQFAPLTTKGDLYSYSTLATRLVVGTVNGQILQVASAAATGLAYSTPTYPSASGTSGQILISDGTNNIYSSALYPATTTINQLLYSSSGNVVSGLATASNGVLVTSNTSVPSILPGPAATGRLLSSNVAAAPSWSTATFPSVGGAAGNILISDGTNYISSTSLWPNTVGSAGKILRSDGTVNAYTTSTFADTYGASTLLYSNGANTVTGLATANSSLLVTTSAGVPVQAGTMTNGQIVIGSTGATPVVGQITGSGGVSVTLGAGTIAISGTTGGVNWTTVTGASQAMAVNSGYITNNAGVVTLTLPATFAVGEVMYIVGLGAGGWLVQANGGQTIHVGSSATSSGGSVASTNQYDSMKLVGTVANTTLSVLGAPQSGALTIA